MSLLSHEEKTSLLESDRPVCHTVEEFVRHVIYDGRFLDNFTAEPEFTASLLGIGMTPEVAEQLRGRKPGKALADVTAGMTGNLDTKEVGIVALVLAAVAPAVVPSIAAIAVVTIGAAIYYIVTPSSEPYVIDRSPGCASKL